MSYRHRCVICGRFAEWGADNSTPFGNSNDYEPPDPEYFCDKHVKELKARALETGWLPTNWVPARWEFEVAAELRKWRAGPEGAAWGGWHSMDKPLSDGYKWHTGIAGYPTPKELIDD